MTPPIPAAWNEIGWLTDVVERGGRAFAVGGAVRDLLLGLPARDLDVVVGGVPREALREILRCHGAVDEVGADFAVFKWRGRGVAAIDVALPRRERSTGPGHRDYEVQGDPEIAIEEDLARRDFTINAIAVELPSEKIVDPLGGRSDLDERLLRAAGEPLERFREDPLRILRGAGFVARFELAVDGATRAAMTEAAPLLETVAAERMASELIKLLLRSRRPSPGLRLLFDVGAMRWLLPELIAGVGFDQRSPHHHLPVDEHTLLTVDEAAARSDDIVVRVAALLHDVAKPSCFSEYPNREGRVVGHFHGHEKEGTRMARRAMSRLRISSASGFPRGGVGEVLALVRHHLVYLRADASDRALRRFLTRVGSLKRMRRLLLLHRADRAAHSGGEEDAAIDMLEARIDELAHDMPLSPHDLALRGGELVSLLGLRGPAVGLAQRWLMGEVIDGRLPNDRGALLKGAKRWAEGDSAVW